MDTYEKITEIDALVRLLSTIMPYEETDSTLTSLKKEVLSALSQDIKDLNESR